MKFLFVCLLGLGSCLVASTQDQPLHLPVDSMTHLVTYGGVIQTARTGQDLFSRTMEWAIGVRGRWRGFRN